MDYLQTYFRNEDQKKKKLEFRKTRSWFSLEETGDIDILQG